MRHTGDYDDLFDWKREDIESLLAPTKELLYKLKSLIPPNTEEIIEGV